MVGPLPIQSTPINNITIMEIVNQGGSIRKRKHRGALDENDDRRSKRLERNRLAAVEFRRRKKHMVEELRRSVHYYSKANAALKSQNADLERQLLLAKQNALANQEKAKSQGTAENSASVRADVQEVSKTKISPSKKTKRDAAIVHESRPYSTIIGNTSYPSNISGIDEQAEQAHLAATQALYKSRGYPAGAARVAANMFSQFVCQTRSVPALETDAAIPEVKKVPKIECNDAAYIQALTRFAMQQASAANAAAAAATAAIQAASLHEQLKDKKNGSPSLTIQALPAMPLPYPAAVLWPCQNQASSAEEV